MYTTQQYPDQIVRFARLKIINLLLQAFRQSRGRTGVKVSGKNALKWRSVIDNGAALRVEGT